MSAEKKPSELSFDERVDRVLKSAEATAKSAEATARAAEVNRKSAEATARAAEANRKSAESAAKADLERFDRLAKEREKERKADLERFDRLAKSAEAAKVAAEATAKAADADRDRFSRLEKEMAKDRENNEGSRRNLARAMEDTFAASLPDAVKAHGIVIRPEDVKMRVRRDNNSREYDFIAPNGDLALAGEVKIRLTFDDVSKFSDSLSNDFREMFPEYAHMPVYGVVAGGAIDADAVRLARKRGFIILRLEGGKAHPATGKGYRPKKF